MLFRDIYKVDSVLPLGDTAVTSSESIQSRNLFSKFWWSVCVCWRRHTTGVNIDMALIPHKLELLMSETHKRAPFSTMGKAEFRAAVQNKVKQSLRDYLKHSSSKLKRSS